jgi:hypothetical protein
MENNPLINIPEELLRKKSEGILYFYFDNDEYSDFGIETRRLINQYFPFNNDLNEDFDIETRRFINQYFPFNNDLNEDFENSGPMRIEELSNVSPIVNESIK